MKLSQAIVLATINDAPNGLTSRQIAEKLNCPLGRASAMAGKLRDYGEIAAVNTSKVRARPEFLWKRK
jgi:hypothetical protein